MSALNRHVEDYLRLRRALGFKLEREGQLLAQLVTYLEADGASTITSEAAVAWARQPAGASRTTGPKDSASRKFAAYLQTIDPATQLPPTGVFPARRRRPTPYLWSQDDIRRLLGGARSLRPPLRSRGKWRC